jgi:hypothetical protein
MNVRVIPIQARRLASWNRNAIFERRIAGFNEGCERHILVAERRDRKWKCRLVEIGLIRPPVQASRLPWWELCMAAEVADRVEDELNADTAISFYRARMSLSPG